MNADQSANLANAANLIWRGPGPRNPFFTGRNSALQDLSERYEKHNQRHVQVIVGMGGVGKTQLASEFAWRSRDKHRIIWWLAADDATTLSLSFAELGRRLNPDLKTTASLDEIRHDLRRTLGKRDDWLLIFDNAESPVAVQDYLPLPCNGRVLITSRDQEWGDVASVFALRALERTDSVAFLRRRVNAADSDDVLRRVAQAMGDHPLALEHAGAYVIENRINFATYLQEFESHWAELLGKGVSHAVPGAEYPDSLAMSLELTFRSLAESKQSALFLLNVCGFFSGEPLPVALFNALGEVGDQLPIEQLEVLREPHRRDEALALLRRYSLVEGDRQKPQIHRLVLLLVRRRLSVVERGEIASLALRAVDRAFQFDGQDPMSWERCNPIVPHLLAAAANAEADSVELPTAAKLLNLAGRLLMKQGQLGEAKDVLTSALDIARRIHGSNHPRLSLFSNDLGRVLQKLGDSHGAREMYDQAISIDTKVYGGNDAHLTSTMNNHAIALHGDGDSAAAREALERALSMAEFHYGTDDRRVVLIRNNLACVIRDGGDLRGAVATFKTALAQAKLVCGESSPTVAHIAFNLGRLHQRMGNAAAGEPLLSAAHRIDSENHPATHPSVIRHGRPATSTPG